jgi:Gas vesicle synthesis protein GvpL/GvpF
MSAVRTREARARPADTYVYGLLAARGPALPGSLTGVGARDVEVVTLDGCLALVSEGVDRDAFGLPADLLAHSHVLDEVARTRTVVPVAFGTFIPRDVTASFDRLREAFDAAVGRVDGAVQFTLTVRYRQDVALAELVREDPRIARLRQQTAGTPEAAFRSAKLQLGELVVQGLDRKAEADAAHVLDALRPLARETAVRDRRQADEVVELAALVDRDRVEAFEAACDGLAATFADRTTVRLLGPQAPYDFVGRS